MDILWALILAFGIHTLDNMWVNWLNYKISTQVKDKEDNNNGVEETGQTHTIGFTQGYRTDNDGKKEEEKGDKTPEAGNGDNGGTIQVG